MTSLPTLPADQSVAPPPTLTTPTAPTPKRQFPIPIKVRRLFYTFLSAFVIILGSFLAIRFAQGYRFSINFNQDRAVVKGTGLLVANSFPSGAQIYLDDRLVSATDNTLNLSPGQYNVKIQKDGYTPWQKNLQVQAELVTQTNAQLYRIVPSLIPLTFSGIKNVSPSPDGQKLIFYTASDSAKVKDGLYVLELSNDFFSNVREPQQIAGESPGFDLNTATYVWSPDDSQVMLSTNGHEVMLNLNSMNDLAALPDITFSKKQTLSDWEYQLYLRERQYLVKFPPEVIQVATESATNVYLSPDKNKLLYTATAAATLPAGLIPPLPARDSQPETRTLEPGSTYIYDREEDKNFLLSLQETATPSATKAMLATDLYNPTPLNLDASPSSFTRLQASTSAQTARNFASYYSSLYSNGLQWFPDSQHVLFSHTDDTGSKIYLLEYDNTNLTTLYNGPFSDNFVYPWPDGSKLLVLTSFSANSPTNLYAIELK